MTSTKHIPASLWLLIAILVIPAILAALSSTIELADQECAAGKTANRHCP